MGLMDTVWRWLVGGGAVGSVEAAAAPVQPGLVGSRNLRITPVLTTSGVRVTEETALKLSTVWRCVNLIAGTVGYLPLEVRTRTGSGAYAVADDTDPAVRVLTHAAHDDLGARKFRQTLVAHRLLWGNGYAVIEKTREGDPVTLTPIDPDQVTPERNERGQLQYVYDPPGDDKMVYQASEVFHLRGLGFDGLRGYSVIAMARQAIGTALAAEGVASAFYGNGMHLNGVLTVPEVLDDDVLERMRAQWRETYGGINKAGETLILEQGAKYESIALPAKDAQFLETREFQVADIGPRWFGVPNSFLGDMSKATFNNFEQMNLMFLQHAILPVIGDFEEECKLKLFSAFEPRTGQRVPDGRYVKLKTKGLLRGDLKAQAEWYQRMRDLAVYSVDEIRELEDLNPLATAGDTRLVPGNMVRLEDAGSQMGASRGGDVGASIGGRANEDVGVPRGKDAGKDACTTMAARLILGDACGRIATKERRAVEKARMKWGSDAAGFDAWAAGWYGEHERFVRECLAGPVRGLAVMGGGLPEAVLEAVLDGLAARYAGHAQRVAVEGGDVDVGWLMEQAVDVVCGKAAKMEEAGEDASVPGVAKRDVARVARGVAVNNVTEVQ